MSTALITGATGFIGQAACEQLLARGWQVKGTFRSSSQNDGNLPAGIVPCSVDSLGPGTDWRKALSGIEVIVHLAARVHIMKETSDDSLWEFRQVNTHATERLARMAAQTGARRFVFLSTVKVNGENSGDRAFTETDPPNPQDNYALSKWEAEQALRRVAQETGLDVVILRSPLVYGPGVKGNFMRLLQAVQRGIPLPLASVHNRRSVVFLGNLVEAVIACMTNPQAKAKTYLVSDDEQISTAELIAHIAHALGKSPRLWPFPERLLRYGGVLVGKSAEADRLLNSLVVDSSKIRSELGWKPHFSLDEGLSETARWFLETGATAA